MTFHNFCKNYFFCNQILCGTSVYGCYILDPLLYILSILFCRHVHQVWHFSTAFTPVTSWGFTDHPPIAEHLKHCPFNIRNTSSAPVRVMGNTVDAAKIANLKETPRRDKKVNGQNEWDLDEDDVELLHDVDNWYFCEACS